jgi:trans-aconitate methyltransferase
MDPKWRKETENLSLKGQWEKLFQIKIKQAHKGLWGAGEGMKNAQEIINFLPVVFKDLNIKTFIDCGCGNFFWMNKVNFGETKYLGIDIVKDLIELNKRNYPEVNFKCMNIVDELIPKMDFVFARSVFIHLQTKDILKALKNIKSSGSKYLMTSTSPQVKENKDTECIMMVKRNLERAPFNFPKPITLLNERPDISNPKLLPVISYMGVWKIDELL